MRIAWLFLLVWPAAATDWMQEVRERGAALEGQRQWEQASEVYRSALGRADGSGDRFWLLTSLAEVAFERQEYGLARGWLRDAEAVVSSFPSDAPERLRLVNAWGTLHLVQGNLTAAERELSSAVVLDESVATAADRAAVLHNLAAVEMQIGRLAEASVHQTRALELWRREFGERHHYVMKAWISLSSLQGLRGDWRAAEESLKHALAIAETPEAWANYAVVLEKLKRGREAKAIRKQLGVTVFASPMVDVKAMAQDGGRPAIRTR